MGTGVSPIIANMGDLAPAPRAAQPGSGQSAGGGMARLASDVGEGRPAIGYAPGTGRGMDCAPGTRSVASPTTRGRRREIACH